MSARRRRWPALIAALFLALLLAPASFADHVYSHRFVFDGRLVGNDGLPLPGREMQFVSTGQDLLEPCREGSHPVTDEFGDFRFCFHVHDLERTTRVSVLYGNVTITRPVDIAMRRVSGLLREPNETGVAPPNWTESFRISGRAWAAGEIRLEGVQVFGQAVIDLPVNLTVKVPGQDDTVFHTLTDGHGDFDLLVQTAANASEMSLSLEAKGLGQPVQVDEFFHRTYAPIYLNPPLPNEEVGVEVAAPGSVSPRPSPVMGVIIAIGVVLALWFAGGRKGS